jgi:uncharacterized protein YaiL (DUF2058 family)
MQSLRDKLLKAGVVTQEQADRSVAKQESERKAKAARAHSSPKPPPRAAPPKAQAQTRPHAPVHKVERVESEKDRERRLNREMAERQKMLRSLVDATEVTERGEQAFFYRTRRRELRRMYLLPKQVEALEKGELAIVDRPNGQDRPHALVSREVAESVLKLEQKAIRFWAKSPTEHFGFEDEPATNPEEQAQATEASAHDDVQTPVESESESEPKSEAEAATEGEVEAKVGSQNNA